MRLFRSSARPDVWVAFEHGRLVEWPARRRGWHKRVPFTGSPSELEEVDPVLARGTSMPGGPRGPKPRSDEGTAEITLGVRLTPSELEAWEAAAKDQGKAPSTFVRDLVNELLQS